MSTRTAELLASIALLVFSLGLMWTVHADGLKIWLGARARPRIRRLAILVKLGHGVNLVVDNGALVSSHNTREPE